MYNVYRISYILYIYILYIIYILYYLPYFILLYIQALYESTPDYIPIHHVTFCMLNMAIKLYYLLFILMKWSPQLPKCLLPGSVSGSHTSTCPCRPVAVSSVAGAPGLSSLRWRGLPSSVCSPSALSPTFVEGSSPSHCRDQQLVHDIYF